MMNTKLTKTQEKYLAIVREGGWIYDGRDSGNGIEVVALHIGKHTKSYPAGKISAKTFEALKPYLAGQGRHHYLKGGE